jgi:hypothetical protein
MKRALAPLVLLLFARTASAQQPPQPYGGLAPPPSGPTTPGTPATMPPPGGPPGYTSNAYNNGQPPPGQAPRSDTERALKDAEDRDSHRGLEWFSLQPEVGLQHLSLTAFSGSSQGSASTSGFGPVLGALANVRLLFVTIGVRARYGIYSDYKLWNVGPEVGFHLPIGNLEPYGFVGGGLSGLAGLPSVGNVDLSASGFHIRIGGGLDYYLSRSFSVGGAISTEMVKLSYSASGTDGGSSTGLATAFSLLLGLHLLDAVLPLAWLALCLVPTGALVALAWRAGARASRREALGTLALGALMGAIAVAIERVVLRASTGETGAIPLLIAVAFVAPLEQGLTAAAAWPTIGRGKVRSVGRAVLLGGLAAAGAATVRGMVAMLAVPPRGVGGVLRAALATPSWVFLSMAWAFTLGRSRRRRFFPAWIGAVLAHGLIVRLLSLRAHVGLAFVVPLLLAMAALGWVARNEMADAERVSLTMMRAPVSLRGMTDALGRHDRPISLWYVAVGALVNQGLLVLMLTAAVIAGRRLGLDFASLDDTETAAVAPLALLGTSAALAFPLGGFVLARASQAPTLLEPALSAALAIALLTVMLGMAAPIALAFALSCVPVVLALACVGAWVGMARLHSGETSPEGTGNRRRATVNG